MPEPFLHIGYPVSYTHLADSGEVNILATISSNKCATAVPCIDVINTYFGRPDIPIGAVRGEAADRTTWHSGLRWTDELPMKYPHRILTTADSEDALKPVSYTHLDVYKRQVINH